MSSRLILCIAGGGVALFVAYILIGTGGQLGVGSGVAPASASEVSSSSIAEPLAEHNPDPGKDNRAAQQGHQALQSTPASGMAQAHETPFARSDDLWALAVRASNSADSRLQHQGMAAARECGGLIGIQDSLRVQIQSDAVNRASRDIALTELLRRCRGFLTSDATAIRLNSQRLRDLEAKNQPATDQAVSEHTVKRLNQLKTGTSVDTQSSLIEVANFVIAEANTQNDGPAFEKRSDLFMLAALKAACDLGKDCSEQAFDVLLQCAMVGACGGSIFRQRDANLSEDEWNQVLQYRTAILAAVKAGSLSAVIADLRGR